MPKFHFDAELDARASERHVLGACPTQRDA